MAAAKSPPRLRRIFLVVAVMLGISVAITLRLRARPAALVNPEQRRLFEPKGPVYAEHCPSSSIVPRQQTYSCPFVVGWRAHPFSQDEEQPRVFLQVLFSSLGMDLLPHFVDHYSSLGLDTAYWIVSLHLPPNATAAEKEHVRAAEKYLETERIPYYVWRSAYSSDARKELFANLLVCQNASRRDWIIYVDSDEFQEWGPLMAREGVNSLPALLRTYALRGHLWVRGELADRLTEDGSLVNARPDRPLSEQFPLICAFGAEVTDMMTSKVVAFRGGLRLHRGHHFVEHAIDCTGRAARVKDQLQKRAPKSVVQVSHYKWRHDVKELLERRVESYKALGFFWWRQSAQLLKHIEEHGRVCIECISCNRTLR